MKEYKEQTEDGKVVVAKSISNNKVLFIPINNATEITYLDANKFEKSPYKLFCGDLVILKAENGKFNFEKLVASSDAYDRIDTIMHFAKNLERLAFENKYKYYYVKDIETCMSNFAFALIEISKELTNINKEDEASLLMQEVLIKNCLKKSDSIFNNSTTINQNNKSSFKVTQNVQKLYLGMKNYSEILGQSDFNISKTQQTHFEVSNEQSTL